MAKKFKPASKVKSKNPSRKMVKIGDAQQFQLVVYENEKPMSEQGLFDPFIRTTIQLKGWRAAWRVLFGGVTYKIHINGTREAVKAIFDGNYKPLPETPKTVPQGAEQTSD